MKRDQTFDEGKIALTERLNPKNDFLCVIDGQEKVNVEMQVRRFARMDYRSLYYLASMLTDTIHKGETYSDLKRSIAVNIT